MSVSSRDPGPRRLLPALLCALAASACSASVSSESATGADAADAQKPPGGDDRSRCDYKGRGDRDVRETSGPGAIHPNIRRVFGFQGDPAEGRRVLLCREVDTNLDGIKDVVRLYDEHGEALEEQADSNYDGSIDTWVRFSNGRIAKVDIDNTGDGRPDEVRYYIRGKLRRIQRDTNGDAKPDVWEVYDDGKIERMGVDLDHDGHVDRWDRDEIRRAEEARKEEEEEAKAKAKEAKTPRRPRAKMARRVSATARPPSTTLADQPPR